MKLELRKQQESVARAKTKNKVDKKRVATKGVESLHGEESLFEALRGLRAKLAKENNVPPYIIFSDKSLHDMCSIKPRNDHEFLMVNGVGQTKLENYGDDFISVIRQYA